MGNDPEQFVEQIQPWSCVSTFQNDELLPEGEILQDDDKVAFIRAWLRRDPHRYVKQIHHEELEDGEKERPSAFPKIMLKQTDSGIQ